MNANEIGCFLTELRKQKGLKQRELAEMIQVSDKAISRWETGRGIPDVVSLQNLSEFYSVTINEILEGRYIKEEETKKVADQNITELVKREFNLKKKLLVAIITIVGLLIFGGIGLISRPAAALCYAYCASDGSIENIDLTNTFRDVADLENAGIEYSVSFDTDNKSITIHIEDYSKYEDYVKSDYK